jgi:catechol 2,3-dioxygenase-like lactoylglutathione lyase family enzyme
VTHQRILRQLAALFCLLAASASSLLAQATYAQARIDIGLVVSDLDRSVAFYENALGMQRAYSFNVDTAFARESGLTAGAPLHAVAMKLTDEEGTPVLKLVRVGAPEAYRPRFIDEQSGIRYLTVFVTALAPVLERLERHQVPVLGRGPVQMSNGESFALVQDPDGVFVELIGPMRAQRAAP